MPPNLSALRISELVGQLETMQKLKSIVALPGKNLIKDYDQPINGGVNEVLVSETGGAVPIRIPCHMLSHPWHQSCKRATWDVLVTDVTNCLKIYSALYAASGTMRCKSWTYWRHHIWKDILRSTLMLSANRVFIFGGNCLTRYLFGKTTKTSLSMVGFIGSFLAILFERISRRNLLAFYMGSNAVECFFNRLIEKGTLKSVKHIEVLMFMVGSAILGALLKSRKEALSGMLRPIETIIGFSETQQPQAVVATPPDAPADDVIAAEKEDGRPSKDDFLLSTLHKFHLFNKLQLSFNQFFNQGSPNPEDVWSPRFSCHQYIIQGGLRGFSTGFLASFTVSLLRNMANIFQPRKFLSRVFSAYNLRVAAFTALFVSSFRTCCCVLRKVIGENGAVTGAIAGFVSGIAFMVLKSYIIALYLLLKALEVMFKFLTKDTWIDRIPFKTELIYSLAVMETAFGLVVHPQNVRADYRKFVNNITSGKITSFNRQIAGAHWAYPFQEVPLYPEFDPELAERCVEWVKRSRELSRK